jgi:hypothetical protein
MKFGTFIFNAFAILIIIVLVSSISLKITTDYLDTMNKYNFDDAKFLIIAGQKFSEQHNYSIDGYNCVNYTNDFNSLMNELGYDMFAVRGTTLNKTSAHAWSCASFSSQNGIFTDFREEYPLDRKVLG